MSFELLSVAFSFGEESGTMFMKCCRALVVYAATLHAHAHAHAQIMRTLLLGGGALLKETTLLAVGV